MTTPAAQREPWDDERLLGLVLATLVGLAAITAAWFGASGSTRPSTQVAWLQLGIAGLIVSAFGHVLWLLRGRRAIGRRRVALLADVPRPDARTPEPRAARTGVPSDAQGLVRVAGLRRVHLPDCPLVAAKAVQPAAATDGAACGVCRP